MSEAEASLAARIVEDVERLLGVGLVVEDVEIEDGGPVTVRAEVLVDGRAEAIEARGGTVDEAYRQLVRQVAELRLGAAWWQMVGPT